MLSQCPVSRLDDTEACRCVQCFSAIVVRYITRLHQSARCLYSNAWAGKDKSCQAELGGNLVHVSMIRHEQMTIFRWRPHLKCLRKDWFVHKWRLSKNDRCVSTAQGTWATSTGLESNNNNNNTNKNSRMRFRNYSNNNILTPVAQGPAGKAPATVMSTTSVVPTATATMTITAATGTPVLCCSGSCHFP